MCSCIPSSNYKMGKKNIYTQYLTTNDILYIVEVSIVTRARKPNELRPRIFAVSPTAIFIIRNPFCCILLFDEVFLFFFLRPFGSLLSLSRFSIHSKIEISLLICMVAPLQSNSYKFIRCLLSEYFYPIY